MTRLLMAMLIVFSCAGIQAATIGEAKSLTDGESVSLSHVVATAGWESTPGIARIYVQEQDRSAGIAVFIPIAEVEDGEDGMIVNLSGTMGTVSGERCINSTSLVLLPALGMPRPLGLPNLGRRDGLDVGGLYIRTWGAAVDMPAPAAGDYPHSFRLAGAAGEFTVVNYRTDRVYEERFLIPVAGQDIKVTGVLLGGPGERTIHHEPEFEIDALGSWNHPTHYEGWASIRDVKGRATAMSVSGPGLNGWQPMQLEDGLWRSFGWWLPEGPPPVPFECQFKITEPDRESIYKGWITGYMPTYQTNVSPAEGAHVFGKLTFAWALPSSGGPYNSIIFLTRYEPTSYDFGVLEGGSGTSMTFTSPQLTPGRYAWSLFVFDERGNALSAGSNVSFYYGM